LFEKENAEGIQKFVTQNNQARKRSGDELECLVALGMVKASRLNGVKGTLLREYILKLVKELLPDHCHIGDWRTFPDLHESLHVLVPCLGPVNRKWPPEVSTFRGCCFGNLERPRDKVGLDVRVFHNAELILTAEAKNHERNVDMTLLKHCLRNTINKGNVHLFVFGTAQERYFTRGTKWAAWKKKNKHQSTNVANLVCKNDTLVLEPISGMPWIAWRTCRKLVIIIAQETLCEATAPSKRNAEEQEPGMC
jgi:hypothetical protein